MSRRAKKRKCLIPECPNVDLVGRGLCRACYNATNRLVNEGRVSWAQLEAKGLALPRHAKVNSGNAAMRAIADALPIDEQPTTNDVTNQ